MVRYEHGIITKDNNGRLHCSCSWTKQYALPCRHVLAKNRGKVKLEDIGLRWMKLLECGYLDDPKHGTCHSVLVPSFFLFCFSFYNS